jgi:hypothetical protein
MRASLKRARLLRRHDEARCNCCAPVAHHLELHPGRDRHLLLDARPAPRGTRTLQLPAHAPPRRAARHWGEPRCGPRGAVHAARIGTRGAAASLLIRWRPLRPSAAAAAAVPINGKPLLLLLLPIVLAASEFPAILDPRARPRPLRRRRTDLPAMAMPRAATQSQCPLRARSGHRHPRLRRERPAGSPHRHPAECHREGGPGASCARPLPVGPVRTIEMRGPGHHQRKMTLPAAKNILSESATERGGVGRHKDTADVTHGEHAGGFT